MKVKQWPPCQPQPWDLVICDLQCVLLYSPLLNCAVCVCDRLLLRPQVNNATARVMTNKKIVSPYPNGEALSALPYGNNQTDTH